MAQSSNQVNILNLICFVCVDINICMFDISEEQLQFTNDVLLNKDYSLRKIVNRICNGRDKIKKKNLVTYGSPTNEKMPV